MSRDYIADPAEDAAFSLRSIAESLAEIARVIAPHCPDCGAPLVYKATDETWHKDGPCAWPKR